MNACSNRWLFLCFLSIVLLLNSACENKKIDPRTLCPVNGSEKQTILLIDTTDPLPPKAHERLKQLLKAFRDSDNQFYLQTSHELIVYRLTPNVTDIRKLLRVCNPGNNPEERTWKDNLVSGKYDGLRKWRHFEHSILQALPKNDEHPVKQSSLLETIAFITARHVPSLGVVKRKPTRLILFSDMLQNSDYLSHYKSLPEMKTFKTLPGYPAMDSDLRDVDVWLMYVRRPGLENKQTPEHYYWWTQAIELFGGRLMEQKDL